ncbi:MAG: T9SS type A sorting domain-containing protein [bacterium]
MIAKSFFNRWLTIVFLLAGLGASAQYPPPAGQPGSTAISKDSSIIVGWAKSCQVERGFIDISDTTKTFGGSNRASYGNVFMTAEIADGFVLSLGDRGVATLDFESPIGNGPGFDFAIFENSFDDIFLELAFVEVSSDGIRFVQFPAISLIPASPQTTTFGSTDATKINNFAGKYRGMYGTPFDLEELKDSTGINLNHIIMIRIVDVVGSVQDPFATYDSQGNKVNDPWPTPFDTGGFDLDALAVLHFSSEGIEETDQFHQVSIFPNPVSDMTSFVSQYASAVSYSLSDQYGKIISSGSFTGKTGVDLTSCSAGVYFASFHFRDGVTLNKKIIRK